MGFDLTIRCVLSMCSETGKPYYWLNSERVYTLPPIVPEQHRKYLNQRGHHFHAYIERFKDYTHVYEMSVESFLDGYPTWETVMNSEIRKEYSIEEYWTKKDHNGFERALEWLSRQMGQFSINWSY